MERGAVADLVTRARDGDEGAWDELVERYLGMVHAICRGHRLDGAGASAVNEVVWLRLAEHLAHLRTPGGGGRVDRGDGPPRVPATRSASVPATRTTTVTRPPVTTAPASTPACWSTSATGPCWAPSAASTPAASACCGC